MPWGFAAILAGLLLALYAGYRAQNRDLIQPQQTTIYAPVMAGFVDVSVDSTVVRGDFPWKFEVGDLMILPLKDGGHELYRIERFQQQFKSGLWYKTVAICYPVYPGGFRLGGSGFTTILERSPVLVGFQTKTLLERYGYDLSACKALT